MNYKKSKAFTLVEVIVVMGIMGLVMGGILVSMREVIEGEMLLKRMQQAEEDSRFVMDVFAQDAGYSELWSKPTGNLGGSSSIRFLLTEKVSDISSDQDTVKLVEYKSYPSSSYSQGPFYIQRNYIEKNTKTEQESVISSSIINTLPLEKQPLFIISKVQNEDTGVENYFITISIVFLVPTRDPNNPIKVPAQTSIMSRTFEF